MRRGCTGMPLPHAGRARGTTNAPASGLTPYRPQQKSRQVGERILVGLDRLRARAFALDRFASGARLVDAGDRCGRLLAARGVVAAAVPAAAGFLTLTMRMPLGTRM